MNNDLISREALKKEIESLVVGGAEGLKNYYENGSMSDQSAWIGGIFDAWELINTAPTVEPFEPDYVGAERSKARQRGYEEGYHTGMEIGKTLNPKIKQGEWIARNDETHYCSNCRGDAIDGDFDEILTTFCPHCGAKMKGGEEE